MIARVQWYDSSGNLLWARVYDGPADDVASSVIETMSKDIVVAGHTRSFGAGLHDFLLLKTDSLGNLQWVKTYGGSNEDWAYSVYETYDPGSTESFGAGLKDLPFPSPTDFRYGFCPRGLYPILRLGISGLYGCENRYWGPNTYGDLAVYGGKCYKPHYHIFIFGK
jgi:hypothetical protein